MKGFLYLLFALLGVNVFSQVNTTDPILYYEQGMESVAMWPGCESILYPVDCTIEKIKSHIRQNLVYPKKELYQGVSGRVWLSFVVAKDGAITDIRLERGIATGCDEEAIRIVSLFPQFLPAQKNMEVVSCGFKLAVIFELPEDYWKNRKKKYSKKALGLE